MLNTLINNLILITTRIHVSFFKVSGVPHIRHGSTPPMPRRPLPSGRPFCYPPHPLPELTLCHIPVARVKRNRHTCVPKWVQGVMDPYKVRPQQLKKLTLQQCRTIQHAGPQGIVATGALLSAENIIMCLRHVQQGNNLRPQEQFLVEAVAHTILLLATLVDPLCMACDKCNVVSVAWCGVV